MFRPLALTTTLAACVLASVAAAQPSSQAQAGPPVAVAGVDVVATNPPVIVATYPAAGAQVSPGVLVIKIVFDQAMTADRWSYAKTAQADFPPCLATPRLLADGKTFVLLCTAGGTKTYGIDVNTDPEKAFVNIGDRRSAPYELRFSTTADDPVRTLKGAMTKAGLGELDMPVESMGAFVRPAPTAR